MKNKPLIKTLKSMGIFAITSFFMLFFTTLFTGGRSSNQPFGIGSPPPQWHRISLKKTIESTSLFVFGSLFSTLMSFPLFYQYYKKESLKQEQQDKENKKDKDP